MVVSACTTGSVGPVETRGTRKCVFIGKRASVIVTRARICIARWCLLIPMGMVPPPRGLMGMLIIRASRGRGGARILVPGVLVVAAAADVVVLDVEGELVVGGEWLSRLIKFVIIGLKGAVVMERGVSSFTLGV